MKRVFVLLLLLFAGGGVVWGGTNETRTTDVSFTARVDGAEQRYVLMLPAGSAHNEIGRAHVWAPVTIRPRLTSSD